MILGQLSPQELWRINDRRREYYNRQLIRAKQNFDDYDTNEEESDQFYYD